MQGETGNLFKALRSLNIGNRYLLTGTPLNNSVSEIFNLMSLCAFLLLSGGCKTQTYIQH